MKEMNFTTLAQAKRYDVTKDEIVEFFQEFGYTYSHTETVKTRNFPNYQMLQFKDKDNDDVVYSVSILHGNCPECGEKCVMYGWSESGVCYISTCKCEALIF